MPNAYCVFCASSKHIEPIYNEAARQLGTLIGERRATLVWGGTNVGMMGILADAVRQHGGTTVGILPSWMQSRGIGYENAEELIAVADMRSRKAEMELRSDAFIALPGGFGTLEELIEIITLKHLEQHNKPIVLINTDGFYNKLLEFFDHLYETGFAKARYRNHFTVVDSPATALHLIDTYTPPTPTPKY